MVLAKTRIALSLLAFLFATQLAYADRYALPLTGTISVQVGLVKVVHRYDWHAGDYVNLKTGVISRWHPFEDTNSVSTIECFDASTDSLIWKSSCPLFTHIWVDSSTNYVVGLSNIKLQGPFQVVVFDNNGEVALNRMIHATGRCWSAEEFQVALSERPELREQLDGQITLYDGGVFVAYMTNEMGTSSFPCAVTYPRDNNHCSNPVSSSITESVSLQVNWYDAENPDIRLTFDGHVLVSLTVNDPKGLPITFEPFTNFPWED